MKMKISTAIERAINTTLWDGIEPLLPSANKSGLSCIAVNILPDVTGPLYDRIYAGLENMGLNTLSRFQFHDIKHGCKRQYARALWLTWAALMAEEQGD